MFEEYEKIDLTQTLAPDIPTWTGKCNFSSSVKMDYDEGARVLSYRTMAGVGTHMDAPSHFFLKGSHISELSIEQFFAPISVVDVSDKADSNYFISEEDLLEYEKKYQKIPENSFVIGFTGWQKFWSHPEKYRNEDCHQIKHFPGFSSRCAEILIERNVVGIGIDTLSPDGSNIDFPVHEIVLGAGKYIIENLTNLEKIPPKGAYGIILPSKIGEATESFVRVIALKPH